MNTRDLPLNEPLVERHLNQFETLVARHDAFLDWAEGRKWGQTCSAVNRSAFSLRRLEVLDEMEALGFLSLVQGKDPNPRKGEPA